MGFQFQYGAIEGLHPQPHCPHLFHFNSSMVRLKGELLEHDQPGPFNFNSSMVRLKAAFFSTVLIGQ